MKGTCNCKGISFEVSADINKLYQCHCLLCQKQSGSTSNTATMVKITDFNWLSGEDLISHWKKPSGFTSDFCKTCGSPVPNRLRDTDYMWIPMGLVESTEAQVVAHICCSAKAKWDNKNEVAYVFEEMPNNVDDFIKKLNT